VLEGLISASAVSGFADGPNLSFSHVTYLLAALRKADKDLFSALSTTRAELSETQKLLQSVIEEQHELKRERKARVATLEGRLSAQRVLAERLQGEEKAIEEILSQLQAQSLRVETVVAGITSTEAESEPELKAGLSLDVVRASRRSAPPAAEVMVSGSEFSSSTGGRALDRQPFQGKGIRPQRKSLGLPAKGTVIRGFGKQRHAEFSDFVFQRGVEMAVVSELVARSIAPGRVVFSGQLPGFGTVIIVDHGKRSHSLYGRLGEAAVTPGEEVAKGQTLATLTLGDRRASNFYFEVRENGSPVNPRVFFPNL
jgi:septal ring factor EnvC (AmiA/AmiB activator)